MSANAERFAQIVRERREHLDLTQLDVWQAGGPSNTTLTRIENGQVDVLTRTTARKLDAGLRWEPGSAKATWAGGDPVPLPTAEDDPVVASIMADASLSARDKRRLIAAVTEARQSDPPPPQAEAPGQSA